MSKYVVQYVIHASAALLLTGLLSSFAYQANAGDQASVTGCTQVEHRDATMYPQSWPHIEQKATLEPSCWVHGSQVELFGQGSELVWVDVRPLPQKKAYPLNRVLALSLHELQDRVFLQEQHLVLVGTGFDQVQLNQTCMQLRDSGFKNVTALHGGVRTWAQLQQASHTVPQFSNEITPEEFWLGSQATPWKVITLGINEGAIQHLPEAPVEQLDLSSGNIQTSLAQALKNQALGNQDSANLNHILNIVLIAPDEKITLQLQRQLQDGAVTHNVVWLQGGLKAYERYIVQQHHILTYTGMSLARPCGSAL